MGIKYKERNRTFIIQNINKSSSNLLQNLKCFTTYAKQVKSGKEGGTEEKAIEAQYILIAISSAS